MESAEPEVTPLVPGRSCGPCTVCCTALTIDDPELRKPQGYRCRNLHPAGGCAVYQTRPQTCRTFYCGWRHLKWVKEGLRPDKSGVLIRFHNKFDPSDESVSHGVVITLLNAASLKAEGLAETVAAAVAAKVPVFVSVPGPPGYTAGIAQVNEALGDAVHFKDKAGVLAILRTARAKGLSGDHKPISFKASPPPPEPSPPA